MYKIKEGTKIILMGNNVSPMTYKEFIDQNIFKYEFVAIADNFLHDNNVYVRGLEIIDHNEALNRAEFIILFDDDWNDQISKFSQTNKVLYRDYLPYWMFNLLYEKSSISYTKMKQYISEDLLDVAVKYLNYYKKIAVTYGDAQMSNIVRFLTVTNEFTDEFLLITLPPSTSMEKNGEDIPKKVLNYASLLLCQSYIGKNYSQYDYENILELVPKSCKKILIPRIHWDAYYPQFCLNKYNFIDKTSEVTKGRFPYGDKNIEMLIKNNSSIDEIFNFVSRYDLYSEEDLQNRLEKNIEWLKQEEQSCDIKIVDYLLKNHSKFKCFLAPDKPSKRLYKYIVENIMNFLNYKNYKINSQVIELEDFNYELPIYPNVSLKMGLKFDDGLWNVCWNYFMRNIDLKEYVNEYVKYCFDKSTFD